MRRSLNISQEEFQRGLAMLNSSIADFRRVTAAASLEQATSQLDDLKKRLKREFRRKALELHPDRTGGDPDKANDFVLIQKVLEAAEQFQVTRRPRPTVRINNFVGTSTVSSATSSTTTMNGIHTVWVKMG